MKKSFLLFACGFFSALPLARAGDLTGTITLKGTPPAESDLGSYIQSDPNCSVLYSGAMPRSEEHTSELQSPKVISYAVFCL